MLKIIDDTKRSIPSFRCNGTIDGNDNRCKLHCRSQGYKDGACYEYRNDKYCRCLKSPITRSTFFKRLRTSSNGFHL